MARVPRSELHARYGTASALYATLDGRHRPEDVAGGIRLMLSARLTPDEDAMLSRVARVGYSWSSMPSVFDDVAGLARQTATLCTYLGWPALSPAAAADPLVVRDLLDRARTVIGMHPGPGAASYRHDRLSEAERKARLPGLTRRRYNKIFRIVRHVETEFSALGGQLRLHRLTQIAKTSYAADITRAAFETDADTAAFVAYYTAALGRRSVFTNGKQQRAFDEVAEMLLARLGPGANWYVVAHVFPRADVLAHLSDPEKMDLLDKTLTVLHECAHLLREAWVTSNINVDAMVVRQGNDSSTWNALAGAWNRARDYWLALAPTQTFDAFLPGKVLRLMAADVAHWHTDSGDGLHDDTAVWRALPKPWDVMDGAVGCTRQMVEDACLRHGIDPAKSGWSAARDRISVEAWTPTPELVHGVSVGHPGLAAWLRRIGAFSGYGLKVAV